MPKLKELLKEIRDIDLLTKIFSQTENYDKLPHQPESDGDTVLICPHCEKEIRVETSTLDFENGEWIHKCCKDKGSIRKFGNYDLTLCISTVMDFINEEIKPENLDKEIKFPENEKMQNLVEVSKKAFWSE